MEAFSGFSLPNAVPIPEELWEILPELREAELRVLLFLFYKTLGFRKREDAVALPQIVAGTGLSRKAAIRAVQSLESRGYVEVVRRKTPEGDSDTNIYRPRFRAEGNDGRGVVYLVHHPRERSSQGVVNLVHQVVYKVHPHDHAAATAAEEDGDFSRFFKNLFGREPTTDEIAEIRALEAEGVPDETIREGFLDAVRTRRRSDRPPTLKDCLRLVRRRHRKHHPEVNAPEDAETLPASGDRKAAALVPAGADAPAGAIGTPRVPAPQEAPNGLWPGPSPAAADPLSSPDGLEEVWKALAECGCDTPPVRRGLLLLSARYPPETLYAAVVEALAYGTSPQRLLGYVRRVLERMAAENAEAEDAGRPETATASARDGPPTDLPPVDSGVPPPDSRTRELAESRPDFADSRIWQTALGELQLELTRATFETWLRPSRLVARDGDVFVISVANGYARDWLEARLRGVVERVLTRLIGRPASARFVVEGIDAR